MESAKTETKGMEQRCSDAARALLRNRDYEVLDAGWDAENAGSLVARHPDGLTLCFVETGWRLGGPDGDPQPPAEGEQTRRVREAMRWLSGNADALDGSCELSFDEIDVFFAHEGHYALLRHVKDVFAPAAYATA